ncbi:MAG: DUF6794 domain-containing protein [Pseudomonadota bacterium]
MSLPHSVDEAVQVLLTLMPETEQAKVAQVREEDLDRLHLGMGIWIRNNLGLWSGNDELMADTGAYDADGAAAVITRTFWLRVRATRGIQQP